LSRVAKLQCNFNSAFLLKFNFNYFSLDIFQVRRPHLIEIKFQ